MEICGEPSRVASNELALSVLSRIALVSFGGTIEAVGRSRLDQSEYVDGKQYVSPRQLLERIPELNEMATVEVRALRSGPSTGVGPPDWLRLAREVVAIQAEPSVDGVVVTHGTATLEETAYFLQLTARERPPVVVTGAMRPWTAIGSDGDVNVIDAVRVVRSLATTEVGVVVVMNGLIHAARDVTKSRTHGVDAFRSLNYGALGAIHADGTVTVARLSRKSPRFTLDARTELPRVDIVFSYPGADGTAIDAFVTRGARAIVVAGLGSGRPTPDEDRAVDDAVARGVVVVQSSRVGDGHVGRTVRMRERRIVASGDLSPWKVRVAISLLLRETDDSNEIQRLLDSC